MRSEQFRGLWWLPESEDLRLSGTLETFESDPPRLRVVGSFAPVERMGNLTFYPVVQGFTENGKRITLLRGATTDTALSAPGFLTQEITGAAALIGAHFATPEDVVPSKTWAAFTFLPEWLGRGAFQRDTSIEGSISIAYKRPDFPEIMVDGGTVTISAGWATSGDSIRQAVIRADYSFAVAYPAPLEEVLSSRVRPIQNLLTLGVDLPNVTTRITFRSERGTKDRDDELIEAIFAITVPEPPRRSPTAHDMLFSYADVADSFESLLQG
jgi:hypothetical protein